MQLSPLPEPSQHSTFVAYWRGNVPLGQSFWVGFVLLSVTAGVLLTWIYQSLLLRADTGSALILPGGALLVALVAGKVWAIVGCWRAANVRALYGPRFWARTAQACLCIATLNVFSTVVWRTAAIGTATMHGMPVPVAGATVRADRTRIDFNGQIVENSSQALEDAIAATPTAHLVRLESPGGLVTESRKMARLIKLHGLDTEVVGLCASACTITFFSGQTRTVRDDGKLGFHSYSSPNSTPQALLEIEAVEGKAYADAGVPRWFITRMFSIPPAQIWYPSHQDLIAAGFVTDPDPPPQPVLQRAPATTEADATGGNAGGNPVMASASPAPEAAPMPVSAPGALAPLPGAVPMPPAVVPKGPARTIHRRSRPDRD